MSGKMADELRMKSTSRLGIIRIKEYYISSSHVSRRQTLVLLGSTTKTGAWREIFQVSIMILIDLVI